MRAVRDQIRPRFSRDGVGSRSLLDLRAAQQGSWLRNRDRELADMQNKLFSASLLEGKYTSLDARISSLGNALANLEQRVQLIFAGKASEASKLPAVTAAQKIARQRASASDPAAFSGTVIRSVGETGAPAETVREPAQASEPAANITAASGRTPATTGNQAIDNRQPASATPAPQDSGPWAINLMSSIDRKDLERIARRAESADIPTLLTSADIKGRQYWRLQVTGFKSLAKAKARAPAIQQALGIGEVWFLKRKPGSSANDAGQ